MSRAKIVPTPPALELTPDEIALIKNFRMMDQRAKNETFRMAERQATRWPRVPVARLRLISGGAT